MIAYLDTLTIVSPMEIRSQFDIIDITIVNNHILTLVPWSLSSTKLTLDDLRKGISINNPEHASLGGLYKLVQDIVKRAESSNTSECQILTVDGKLINISVSMLEQSEYILYVK